MKQLLYIITDRKKAEDTLISVREESVSYCADSVLLHFYCGNTKDPFPDLLVELSKEILPNAQIVGLSSCGEIIRGGISEACVLLSVLLFNTARVTVLTFPDIRGREKAAGERILSEVEAHEDIKGVELLLAGAGTDSAAIYESLKKSRQGLTFFGGYAAGHDQDRSFPFLITKNGILTDAMAIVFYEGKDLHIDSGRTTGWKPLGKTFRVTEASGQRLYSLNGTPAFDLYDRFLHFPEEECFRDYAMEFPLMIQKGKMRLLRHPQEKYEDSSILLDGNVKKGDEICLSYGAPIEIVSRINKRCDRIRSFEPEAILLYSCRGRKNFWGEMIGWEMEPFQKIAESGGACLDAQIMRNNQTGRVIEHRLTLLSVAMREGKKTGRFIPEVEMDDEILKGRMSLVHRMSVLIESAVDELQKTNDMLIGMNERLARANDELKRLAITDELTGLYNRREIERRIRESFERARDDHRKITLIMLDIDFFKKVNDSYGHDVGDMVLKEVSGILKENTDESHEEAAGRWGGEEFFILLPDKGMQEAIDLAEQIRKVVEQHDFPEARHLTISLGVTCAGEDANYQAVFIRADQALYEAKQNGRNRVCSK